MSADRVGKPGASLGFRADIQGIRALAVLVVLVHHLWPEWLPGGYIGVDVFFVVSGFLITALMLREADSEGRISLRQFYARRARRILPAASLVLLVTVLASLLTLALLRTRTVLEDAIWTTFFLGNVRMASVGSDYFASDAPVSPLRHYWSLAVEEQFYLAWPLVLTLVVAGAMRRHGGRPELVRRWAALLLGLVVVASLLWSLYATTTSPSTAYYSTFTRAHELAIGAMLALAPRVLPLSRVAREGLVWGGLVAIIWAAFTFSDETAFPGFAALVPVLGAAALLAGGGGPQEGYGSRMLGVRPAVRVGDWSYSLYLWHWPLIVIAEANLDPGAYTWGPKLLTAAVALLLSWATFRWVENPFRRGRRWRTVRGGLSIYPASVAAALGLVLVAHVVLVDQLAEDNGVKAVTVAEHPEVIGEGDTLQDLVEASVLAAEEGHRIPGRLTPALVDIGDSTADLGDCDYANGTRELCPLGDPDAERVLVVIGDSLSRAMSPAAVELGRENGYRVYVLGLPGCPATALVQAAQGSSRPDKFCEDFKRWRTSVVADLRPDLVMLASSAQRVIDPKTGRVVGESDSAYLPLAGQGWRKHVADLKRHAERVVVFGNTPRLPVTPGECLTDGQPDLGDCTFPNAPKARDQARVLLDSARLAGAEVVDAEEWFCSDGRCPMVVGKYVTLRDTHHVTREYAEALAGPLAERLGLRRPGRG
ncbi:acyltransferase family protein [Nocardioides gilvus]|uniref:acyltransferase family protein n=1 Tax=Nocardioides gilvus TaxID=1735589 RepID=UPI000D742E57|nr:acyltransferase family protein [Nocardioides gilvus]